MYAVDDDGTEKLISVEDHDIDTDAADVADDPVWTVDAAGLFGDDRSPTYGIGNEQMHVSDDERTLLVWRGSLALGQDAVRLESSRLVAIDADSGDELWRKDGVSLCKWSSICTGDISWEKIEGSTLGTNTRFRSVMGAVELTHIDPRTGEGEWDLAIDDFSDDTVDAASFAGIDGYYLIGDGGRALLVDEETGETRGLEEGEHAACQVDIGFSAPEGSNPLRHQVSFVRSGIAAQSCGADGPDDSPLSMAAVRTAGTTWAPEDEEWRTLEDGPGDDDPMDHWNDDADDDAPRWRVVQTEDALIGYRF
ncbi:hypothetical protein [Agromyces archimandritae]|uniref:Uncharacterized protein n=1 Tax=Agromyces archimandritae TaxID=2781962 RepID=A0A975FK76_9MICO|nr:hypothetical protein [Agromyces archimandritae]QTX03371.1 hypothetical protein G127AT_08235 [Agromyces archimandritae]